MMGRLVRRIVVSCLLATWIVTGVAAASARSASASTPVNEALHGGPVVAGAINIHVIFWESHAVDSAYDAYILQFLNDLDGSRLISTLAPYTGPGIDSSPTGPPGPIVTVAGVFHDTVNPLPTGNDNSIPVHQAVVKELNSVSAQQNWPDSAGNVFLVLTGPGYQANSTVCGWHDGGTDSSNGDQVPYAFIPRPSLTLKTYCDTGGYNPTPSGSVRHDSGVNTTWHELAEMLTDPLPLTGYNDPSQPVPPGGEIGDVCEGQFPGVTGSNHHDIVLNGHPYLVQGIWSPRAQACVVVGSYPGQLANSITGFSGTQGKNGWFYGYYASPPSPVFTRMNVYSSGVWYEDPTRYWTQIDRTWQHPESTTTSGGFVATNQWSVRRWVSTYSGPVQIMGHLAKENTNATSDGTTAHIIIDGTQIAQYAVGGQDGVGFDYTITAIVNVGSTIDFALDPNSTDWGDGTYFTAIVSSI